MSAPLNLGIDIGGTNTQIGLVDDAGGVLASVSFPTQGAQDHHWFIDKLLQESQALLRSQDLVLEDIDSFGVGVPGTVDEATGHIEYCPNIPWTDIPFGELVQQAFGKEVFVSHDVRLAALAEMQYGAGRTYSNILCVLVGTGVGAGIILDGKPICGAFNTAGEMGHMIVQKHGRPCACGRKGCLERYASGTGIAEHAKEVLSADDFQGRAQTTQTVFALAAEGNKKALDLVDEGVEYLALGIANVVNLLSVELVIVGGGVAENPDALFLDPLREYIYTYGYAPWAAQKKLKIEKAALGIDAVMIGAATRGIQAT